MNGNKEHEAIKSAQAPSQKRRLGPNKKKNEQKIRKRLAFKRQRGFQAPLLERGGRGNGGAWAEKGKGLAGSKQKNLLSALGAVVFA